MFVRLSQQKFASHILNISSKKLTSGNLLNASPTKTQFRPTLDILDWFKKFRQEQYIIKHGGKLWFTMAFDFETFRSEIID